VHQRTHVALGRQAGDEGALAVTGLDDAQPAQHAQPLAQRRTRTAELLAQPALGRQCLADLEHAVRDQALDAFRDDVGHLAALENGFGGRNRGFHDGRTSSKR